LEFYFSDLDICNKILLKLKIAYMPSVIVGLKTKNAYINFFETEGPIFSICQNYMLAAPV
jgi:hypothetical protein